MALQRLRRRRTHRLTPTELDAARAHLSPGDLEAAGARITRVLDLPVGLRTTPIVERVVTAADQMSAMSATTRTARELPDRINLCTTYTAQASSNE
ncbi:hypothetical protein ACQP1G_21530 [Nocardia sp. CA-107356]|uniref:hypothetical protein n=1 Tax=Nocardia sp. CA-107356 TaxID=3239972 RepID=UPI003D9285D5